MLVLFLFLLVQMILSVKCCILFKTLEAVTLLLFWEIYFFFFLFWKLLDHSYVQSSFSRITSDIENNIMKDALQLNNLRTWMNLRAEYFIKALVNIMKQKLMNMPGKDKLHKNTRVNFEEHYTKIYHISLILYVSFSLKSNF